MLRFIKGIWTTTEHDTCKLSRTPTHLYSVAYNFAIQSIHAIHGAGKKVKTTSSGPTVFSWREMSC